MSKKGDEAVSKLLLDKEWPGTINGPSSIRSIWGGSAAFRFQPLIAAIYDDAICRKQRIEH